MNFFMLPGLVHGLELNRTVGRNGRDCDAEIVSVNITVTNQLDLLKLNETAFASDFVSNLNFFIQGKIDLKLNNVTIFRFQSFKVLTILI